MMTPIFEIQKSDDTDEKGQSNRCNLSDICVISIHHCGSKVSGNITEANAWLKEPADFFAIQP